MKDELKSKKSYSDNDDQDDRVKSGTELSEFKEALGLPALLKEDEQGRSLTVHLSE